MSNASIINALPVWLWNFFLDFEGVDLSYYGIKRKLLGSSKLPNL